MPTFAYVGYRGPAPTDGTVDAPTEAVAREILRSDGLIVTSLASDKVSGGLRREIRFRKALKIADTSWMARQLAITTESGMPLARAMSMLARQRSSDTIGKVLADMNERLLAGSTASSAFRAHEAELGPLCVAMVSSGEVSGELGASLSKLAVLLETRDRLRRKVRSALVYPIGVFALSLVIALVMVIFIVPIFVKLFAQLGSKLPLPTLILVGISNTITANIWILPLAAVAIGVGWHQLRTHHDTRKFLDKASLRLPVIGGLLTKAALARVSSTLSTMLSAGVPLLQALDYAQAAAGNLVFADALGGCGDAIREGISLSSAMSRYPEVPEVLPQMIRVGEEAGSVGEVLERYSKRVETEVETTVEGLTAMIEPILVVAIGMLVGSMVVALYLPLVRIISVAGNTQGAAG